MGFHSVPATGKSQYGGKDNLPDEYRYVIYSTYLTRLSGGGADDKVLKRMLEARGYLVRPNGKKGEDALVWPTFPNLKRGPYIVLRAEKVDGDSEPNEGDGDAT